MIGRWAGAGVLAGLICGLVLFAPAAWLAEALAAATANQLQLQDARGSLWHASARLVLTGGEGSHDALALPGRVQWQLQPDWKGLQLQLRADCCTKEPIALALEPAWRGFRLRIADGQSQWPAALLAGLGAPWNTVQPEGHLMLAFNGVSLESAEGRIRMVGSARVDAVAIATRLSTLRPIGSYRLEVRAAAPAGALTLQLQTLEGSLQLSGTGQWSGARWTFRGEASASPGTEAVLGNLLNMVGRRQAAKSIISLG